MSDSDEEDAETERPNRVGVAIAPPPVLQDASAIDITPRATGGPSGASVAAKIMAKYGFKVNWLQFSNSFWIKTDKLKFMAIFRKDKD